MGRKRVKIDVAESKPSVVTEMSLRDDDGLFPFSLSWSWKPIKGNSEVRMGLDFDQFDPAMRTRVLAVNEARSDGHPLDAFLHTAFNELYPWAVEAFGIALKTYCFERRPALETASYARVAVGRFLRFCSSEEIPLDSPEDMNYSLLCHYRAHLRSVDMSSRYKASQFRYVANLIELLMNTRYLRDKWALPKYSSDASETLPMYSDAVMHQLVAACISDIDLVIRRAREFQRLIPTCFESDTRYRTKHGYSTKAAVRRFAENLSLRSGNEALFAQDSTAFQTFTASLTWFRRRNISFKSDLSSILGEADESGTLLGGRAWDFFQREVATFTTLLPFYLIFLIYTGRNRETVNTWQRRYKLRNELVSPLEWADNLSPDKCILRGYKSRGKGRGSIEIDDVHIKKSSVGLYPLLEFVIWFSEPLEKFAAPEHKDLLWLGMDKHYQINPFSSRRLDNKYQTAVREFLERHNISELLPTKNGGFKKEPMSGIDTRRFRKNFAVRELMEAVSDCANHQELADTLRNSLKHGSFDTTIGSYLSHDTTMASRDVAIFTLQSEMLETARRFRGTLNDDGPRSGEPVILARCSDPSSPDFEMANQADDGHCSEYDMCLGCSRSGVFEEHLPRIAMRIIQYEEEKDGMSQAAWDAEYGQKHARAHDVLNSWSDQDAVNDAWTSAKNGEITLPKVMFRG